MPQIVDPLRTLRPLREEEIEQLTTVHDAVATPLAYDVYRSGDELVIEFDAPGVAPEDIDVSVEGRAVVVTLRRSAVTDRQWGWASGEPAGRHGRREGRT